MQSAPKPLKPRGLQEQAMSQESGLSLRERDDLEAAVR
jgi:hypothetical protein